MSAVTPEQSAAITQRGIDVFCEAGAGTGKTRVLVDRFVSAIVDDGVEIGSMLAFTFTDRAADQLRGRIRGALRNRAADAAAADDPEAARELRRLARETEAANISTIHGYCRRLLSTHPAAAGIDPRFRVLDQGESQRLHGRAFWAALEELLSNEDREATARLVAAATPRGLRSIVVAAYDELRSRGHDTPELPAIVPADPDPAVVALASAAQAAIEETRAATGVPAANMAPRLQQAARFEPGSASLDQVIGVELKTSAQAYDGPDCASYREAWSRARRALAEVELAGSYDLLRELLGTYSRSYESLKADRSGLDFEDLQLRSLELLQRNEAVRESTARFTHLLVDEYQDTNEVQRGLVEALQGPDTRVFCVGDELQSIYGFRHADLAVFRSGRARFEQMPDSAGGVLPLTGNFRSQAQVIAAINAGGAAMMGDIYTPLTVGSAEQGQGEGPGVELLLTAAGGACEWGAEEVGLDLDEDEPSPASRVAEARLLAQRLAALCSTGVDRGEIVVLLRSYGGVDAYERALADAGLRPYVIGGRGYWSQQQVGDVLALLGVIANPLDDEAVLGVLSGSACGASPDTLWMLRQLALDRRERERSPRFWPTLRELVLDEIPADAEESLRWARAIDAADIRRIAELHAAVESLRDDNPLLGLQGTIEAACERLGYDLATLMRDGGPARWANVRKLMRLAAEFEANEGADLRSFLEYAAEEAERAGEGEAPIAAEEHDGVRIMTVHAAKGLEFEVVAVPELGRRLLAGFAPAIRLGTMEPGQIEDGEDEEAASPVRVGLRLARLGRPSEKLFELDQLADRAEREESEEELRLAHVAATRARKRLVLSGTFSPSYKPDEEVKSGAPVTERLLRSLATPEILGLIADRESGSTAIAVPAPLPRPGLDHSFEPAEVAVEIRFPGPGEGRSLAPARDVSRHEVPAGAETGPAPLLSLEPPPASAARLSYSALAQYKRCGYRFLVERELGLGADSVEPLAGPGTAVLDEGGSPAADPAAAGGGDELLAPGELGEESAEPSARALRFSFGNAVHRLLEWSARNRLSHPGPERCRRVLRAEGLPDDEKAFERAGSMVLRWLESPLCERLRAAGVELRPEQPFVISLEGTLIRGSIDLFAILPGGEAFVIDYKTDRLNGTPAAEHIERYEVQRSIYALAASGGGRAVNTAYCFLDGDDPPVEQDFDAARLATARDEVVALLAEIAESRFQVTDRPHSSLCGDCPARARLCSHERDAQLRDSPEPPIAPPGRADESAPPPDGPAQLSLLE